MKSSILLVIYSLVTVFTAVAQGEKFEVIYFEPVSFENNYVKVEFDNIVSLEKETKFRMSITNKTNNYIIYNSEESKFDIPNQDVRAKEKSWVIEPLNNSKKVMRAFGKDLHSIREFSYICEGFYQLVEQEPFTADQFRLPPLANTFNVGPMKVMLDKDKRATGGTNVKWKVKYTGEHYGYIYANRVQVLMPDGNLYATTENRQKPIILERGEEKTLPASWNRMPSGRVNDMQKVEMLIQFEGVFVEAIPRQFEGKTLPMNWDSTMTKERN